MWLAGRFSRLEDFVAIGLKLGFPWFELNYQVTPEILGDVRPDQVRVSSVHYPCPRTMPLEAISREDILLSSTQEPKRKRAVAMACHSISLAKRFGAEAVILHMGRVDGCADLERELRQLVEREGPDAPGALQAREALISARAGQQKLHLEAALRSLDELHRYARKMGIRLGLENRVHYYEIPFMEEIELFLDRYPDEVVGYWHDVGHAEVLARMGFHSPLAWLERFKVRLIGIHLHDIRGFRDHRIAGSGEVDFGLIAPYLPDEALRVCEFDQSHSEEEVRQGLAHLRWAGLVP